jgi:hypothetical protein
VVPVYAPLSRYGGLLIGELQVPKVEPKGSAAVFGTFEWISPSSKKRKSQSGTLKVIEALGASYPTISKGVSLLPGGSFTLSVGTQNLSGTWTSDNAPRLARPAKMSFSASTGIFTGKSAALVNGEWVSAPFEGVLLATPLTLPGENTPIQGAGFSLGTSGSSAVRLTVP